MELFFSNVGAVYVYQYNPSVSYVKTIKSINPEHQDQFGSQISAGLNHLVITAPHEDSNISGIQNSINTENNLGTNRGAIYIY